MSTGVVQFLAEGQTVISFSSNDGVNSISAQVTLVVSGKPKPTFVLEENGEGLCARSDGILLTGWHTRLNDDGTSSCYYFDPDTGYAVDGTCLIDGHSYIFSQHYATHQQTMALYHVHSGKRIKNPAEGK